MSKSSFGTLLNIYLFDLSQGRAIRCVPAVPNDQTDRLYKFCCIIFISQYLEVSMWTKKAPTLCLTNCGSTDADTGWLQGLALHPLAYRPAQRALSHQPIIGLAPVCCIEHQYRQPGRYTGSTESSCSRSTFLTHQRYQETACQTTSSKTCEHNVGIDSFIVGINICVILIIFSQTANIV